MRLISADSNIVNVEVFGCHERGLVPYDIRDAAKWILPHVKGYEKRTVRDTIKNEHYEADETEVSKNGQNVYKGVDHCTYTFLLEPVA